MNVKMEELNYRLVCARPRPSLFHLVEPPSPSLSIKGLHENIRGVGLVWEMVEECLG
ncbi:unnamed protein product [Trifolium pratense]|uniref:Uncharacterized protein n=1 Tax=Trifolium pratense TaxID=57577 RepID=A0ACB0KDB9_TRIPR|nr:unnamed protein product [Trifolium pratense]